eukprot:scaffold5365_cov115-Isochrysis_galbana.AAC.2
MTTTSERHFHGSGGVALATPQRTPAAFPKIRSQSLLAQEREEYLFAVLQGLEASGHSSFVRNELSTDLVRLTSPAIDEILPALIEGVGVTAAMVEKRSEQRLRQSFESAKLDQEC